MAILKDWLKGTEYKVLNGTDECEVSEVIYDSRKAAPGTVFVCMKGSRIDSHDFIPDVLKKGCKAIVVEKLFVELPLTADSFKDVNVIYTENARRTLAFLSAARFDYPADKLKLIGLTGTKGKTTTSYMFKAVFDKCGIKAGVIGTNGVVIGDEHIEINNTTPESYELNSFFARMLDAGCEYVVMECSSQGFKMNRTDALKFDYGVFLNISPDHIGPLEHESFEEYLYCKSRLFTQCDTAVVNADDEHTDALMELADFRDKQYRFSIKTNECDAYAYELNFKADKDFAGTEFKMGGDVNGQFRLGIPGDYNVSNALAVITVAYDLGLPMNKVEEALEHVHVTGRSEVVYKSDKFTVLVDYAHNEVAMVNLVATLRKYNPKRLVVVFGCGGNRSKDRRVGMGQTAAHCADLSIITSDNSRFEKPEDIIADIEEAYLGAGGRKEAYVKIPDRRAAIKYALEHAEQGDIIAVIGKGHEDYQEENGVRHHFLDREEILRAKEELGL